MNNRFDGSLQANIQKGLLAEVSAQWAPLGAQQKDILCFVGSNAMGRRSTTGECFPLASILFGLDHLISWKTLWRPFSASSFKERLQLGGSSNQKDRLRGEPFSAGTRNKTRIAAPTVAEEKRLTRKHSPKQAGLPSDRGRLSRGSCMQHESTNLPFYGSSEFQVTNCTGEQEP